MKFGYVRESKGEQDLGTQNDALNKYVVDEIYEERIISSEKNSLQLNELLGKLRSGDTLVIWRLNRLGKTIKQLIALAEDFENRGIFFVSLKEKIDTSTPNGKYLFEMFCEAAQMERDVISERTKSGLLIAKNKGRSGGRKPKDGKNIEKALRMYHSNEFSILDIIETTGLSKTTIYKYVREYKFP